MDKMSKGYYRAGKNWHASQLKKNYEVWIKDFTPITEAG